jgi:DNA-binding NarL/FixJ family response regulator
VKTKPGAPRPSEALPIPAIQATRALRLLLVDDHALVRQGLRAILEAADMEVVGEAGTGNDGVALARSLRPDVVLLDVQLPDVTGHEVLLRLTRLAQAPRVLVVSASNDLATAQRLLERGAAGFVAKACEAAELLHAVHKVARGERYVHAELAQVLALAHVGGGSGSPFDGLSARELEVAKMLVQGLSLQQIAGRLHLSSKTIATYKYRVMDKLGIDSEVPLVHLAIQHGLFAGTQPIVAAA